MGMQSVTPPAQTRVAAVSIGTGLIASICCGGSLLFGAVGLGAAYSALGLGRYIPQALAAGALAIAAINYGFAARRARCADCAGSLERHEVRWSMVRNAAVGLVGMVLSFVFFEWLNHAVVNGSRVSMHHAYRGLISGVPNNHLAYALASFAALGLLWAMPLPRSVPAPHQR
jgi:hypothetical protein